MINVKIGKTGDIVEVDESKFAAHVNEFVFAYGLRQILNDCHSSLTSKVKNEAGETVDNPDYTPDNIMALVAKKLDSLYAGEIRAQRGEGGSGDPVEDRAWTLARKDVVSAARAQGHKVKDIDKEALEKFVDDFLAKNRDDYMAKAKAQLDEERAAAQAVNLKGLFGK